MAWPWSELTPRVYQGHRSDLHWLGVGAQWARLSVMVGVQVPRQRFSEGMWVLEQCHSKLLENRMFENKLKVE